MLRLFSVFIVDFLYSVMYYIHMRLVKLLLLWSLLISSVQAEDWRLVIGSEQGDQLFADVESVEFIPYTITTTNDGMRMVTVMAYVNKDPKDYLPPFAVSIDSAECITNQEGVLVNNFRNNDTKVYHWTSSGKKMYDAQGQWMCGYLRAKLRGS